VPSSPPTCCTRGYLWRHRWVLPKQSEVGRAVVPPTLLYPWSPVSDTGGCGAQQSRDGSCVSVTHPSGFDRLVQMC
jgi:hypothetical protein